MLIELTEYTFPYWKSTDAGKPPADGTLHAYKFARASMLKALCATWYTRHGCQNGSYKGMQPLITVHSVYTWARQPGPAATGRGSTYICTYIHIHMYVVYSKIDWYGYPNPGRIRRIQPDSMTSSVREILESVNNKGPTGVVFLI